MKLTKLNWKLFLVMTLLSFFLISCQGKKEVPGVQTKTEEKKVSDEKKGISDETKEIVVTSKQDVKANNRFEGRVFSKKTNEPIKGVKVELLEQYKVDRDTFTVETPFNPEEPEVVFSAVTDDSGYYRVKNVSSGIYYVRCKADNYATLFENRPVCIKKDWQYNGFDFGVEEGKTLKIKIVDKDNKPIIPDEKSGAQNIIKVYQKPEEYSLAYYCKLCSDQNGTGTIRLIPNIKYDVYVFNKEFTPKFLKDIIVTNQDIEKVITLEKGESFSLTVKDKDDKIIQDAMAIGKVVCQSEELSYLTEWEKADKDGIIKFKNMPISKNNEKDKVTKLSIIVKAPGYSAQSINDKEVREGESKETQIKLKKGFSLKGKVVNESQNPIQSAIVSAKNKDKSFFLGIYVFTSEMGEFVLDNLSDEDYTIISWANGYAKSELKDIKGGSENLVITLEEGATLSGTVMDKNTNKGIMDATLNLWDFNRTFTNSKGQFFFHFIKSGKFSMNAEHIDYAKKKIKEINLGEKEEIKDYKIYLTSGGTISGKVIKKSDKSPIAEANMRVRDEQWLSNNSKTNDRGEYVLNHVMPGKVFVSVDAKGFNKPDEYDLIIKDGEVRENVNFELSQSGSISGKVYNKSQKPVEGAELWMVEQKGMQFTEMFGGQMKTSSDANGSYTIEDIKSETLLSLMAKHKDYAERRKDGIVVKEGQRLENIDFILTEGGSISGKVTDAENHPLEGVKVGNRKQGSGFMGKYMASLAIGRDESELIATDKEGLYKLLHISPGEYTVIASKDGYISENIQNIKIKEGEVRKDVNFVLKPSYIISGLVKNEEGKPVEGAHLICFGFNFKTPTFAEANSDSTGYYELKNLQNIEYMINLTAEGYVKDKKEKIKAPATNVDFVLTKGFSIKGKVIDKSNKKPVQDFEIEISEKQKTYFGFGMNVPQEPGRKESYHNEQGEFTIANLAEITYDFKATAIDYAPSVLSGVAIKKEGNKDLIFELGHGGSVSGKVLEEGTNKAVSGATVSLDAGTEFMGVDFSEIRGEKSGINATSDNEGKFQLKGLVPGSRIIKVTHPEYVKQTKIVNIEEGKDTSDVEIFMQIGGKVVGIVVDNSNNNPISGVKVNIEKSGLLAMYMPEFVGGGTITNSEGKFELEKVPNGKQKFRLTHSDYSSLTTDEVEIKAGEEKDLGILKMGSGGKIAGTVWDTEGNTISGATIFVVGSGGMNNTATDAKGEYEVDKLMPGQYEVVMMETTEGLTAFGGGNQQTKTATVKEGETTIVNFNQKTGFRFYGSVLDGNNPIPGVMVSISKSDLSQGQEGGSAVTDESGFYELKNLTKGEYDISVMKVGQGTFLPIVMKEKGIIEDQDVKRDFFIPQGEISGVVIDKDSKQPISDAKVNLNLVKTTQSIEDLIQKGIWQGIFTNTDYEGKFSYYNVIEGTYDLSAVKETYSQKSMELNISKDQKVSGVQFELEKGEKLIGKAFDKNSRMPLRDLYIKIDNQSGGEAFIGEIKADSDGVFLIDTLSVGNYNLYAWTRNYAPIYIKGLTIQEAEENQIELAFGQGGKGILYVKDSAGNPIEGVKVELLDYNGENIIIPPILSNIYDIWSSIITDANGKVERDHLTQGQYTIKLTKEGYQEKQVDIYVEDEQTTETTVIMSK